MLSSRNPITEQLDATVYLECGSRYWGVRVFEHRGQSTILSRQGRIGDYAPARATEAQSAQEARSQVEASLNYYREKGYQESNPDGAFEWRRLLFQCFGAVDMLPSQLQASLARQLGVGAQRPQDTPLLLEALHEAANLLLDAQLYEDAADCLGWALALDAYHRQSAQQSDQDGDEGSAQPSPQALELLLLRSYVLGALSLGDCTEAVQKRYHQAALADCDAVLASDPENETARTLRSGLEREHEQRRQQQSQTQE